MEKKYCKICGKEITTGKRRCYCSEECYLEANRRMSNNRQKKEMKTLVCPCCGKTFTQNRSVQKYCSWQCQLVAHKDIEKFKFKVSKIAREMGFDLKNFDKILKAKRRFFTTKELHRCPCDANNPDRYCGSPLCIHDVVEFKHCHCNLFHLPEGKELICKK